MGMPRFTRPIDRVRWRETLLNARRARFYFLGAEPTKRSGVRPIDTGALDIELDALSRKIKRLEALR